MTNASRKADGRARRHMGLSIARRLKWSLIGLRNFTEGSFRRAASFSTRRNGEHGGNAEKTLGSSPDVLREISASPFLRVEMQSPIGRRKTEGSFRRDAKTRRKAKECSPPTPSR